ncbi:MAG TPA: AraC family transcriptional regulator [Bacilli bacterium]
MRNRSLLTKLVIFGCILSIFPVIVIGTFSYIQSSKQVQKEINKDKLDYVKQLNSNVEQIFVTVNHTLTNLAESTVMKEALNSNLDAGDFQLYNNLRKEIGFLQSFDTKVEDVIILNRKMNWLVKNSGVYRLNSHKDENMYESYFSMENNSAWKLLRNADFSDSISSSDCPYTISLVRKLPSRESTKFGLAFANIPACSIADMIDSAHDSSEVMILDPDFHIVAGQDRAMLGKTLWDAGFPDNPDLFAGHSGQFMTNQNNRPYSITYMRSPLNGWIYLSSTSISQLTRQSKRIGWFTFYVCMAIILLSVLFVWFATKKLYSPIRNVVKFIEELASVNNKSKKNEMQIIEEQLRELFSSNSKLESELSEHKRQVLYLFLNRLFTGSLPKKEIDANLEYFHLRQKVETWEYMSILTLQVDTLENTRYEIRDIELLHFAVTNIVEHTIPSRHALNPIWLDQTLVVLIGSNHENVNEMDHFVYNMTEALQKNIGDYLKVCVSIGISRSFQKIMDAPRAFLEGIEALKQRIKLGKGVIIPYGIHNRSQQTLSYQYPQHLENDFLDSVKIADQAETLRILRMWMDAVFDQAQTPHDCQISLMQLLNHLLVLKQEAGISFEQIGVQHSSLYEELLSLNTREDVEEWFIKRLVLPLVKVFADRRDSQYHNLSEQIIDIIQNNYDTNITLEDCAAKLHYNANYLSSVFKKETNATFSEYLVNYRFNMSKKWLLETNMTVKEIAERLQYHNAQNFIRSFRKKEGVTPGQFREQHRNR